MLKNLEKILHILFLVFLNLVLYLDWAVYLFIVIHIPKNHLVYLKLLTKNRVFFFMSRQNLSLI